MGSRWQAVDGHPATSVVDLAHQEEIEPVAEVLVFERSVCKLSSNAITL